MLGQYNKESLFTKQVSPKLQAGLAFVGMLFFSMIMTALEFGDNEMFQHFSWMIAAAFMLVYALFNSIFWISSNKPSQYLTESVICYILLSIASSLAAYAITGTSIKDAGSIKAIFIIVTIGYIVFLAIMGTIKQLIAFFNKEQINKLSGKKKKRKKKRNW